MRRKGFLLLALICGLIAAGSTYLYLGNKQHYAPADLKPLVVAKNNIAARSVLKAEQLEIKEVPSQGYPQGGASSVQSIVGSVALVNLKTGDFIVDSVIERSNKDARNISSNSGSLIVPEGKRAVAVPIALVSGVGYLVKPGDHVDILVTMDVKDSGGSAQTVTTLAAQDILVLNTGGDNAASDKSKAEAKAYTLALTVPQAMAVTLGSEKGSLRLLLRNPANTEQQQNTPFTANQFLDPNYFTRFK